MLEVDQKKRITAEGALKHPWFTAMLENRAGFVVKDSDFANKIPIKKMANNNKTNLVTCTPVMAGVKLATAPMQTPFLQGGGSQMRDNTPI